MSAEAVMAACHVVPKPMPISPITKPPARSPLYAEICRGVAGDAVSGQAGGVAARKATAQSAAGGVEISVRHRARLGRNSVTGDGALGSGSAVIMARRTQTNEPARCATLLPLLARLPQPWRCWKWALRQGYACSPMTMPTTMAKAALSPDIRRTCAPAFRCIANDATPMPNGTSTWPGAPGSISIPWIARRRRCALAAGAGLARRG